MFKKVRCLTRPTQARQDALFHGQGRSPFDARSVLSYVSANAAKSGKSVSPKVRQKSENAAGGFFQHSRMEEGQDSND